MKIATGLRVVISKVREILRPARELSLSAGGCADSSDISQNP